VGVAERFFTIDSDETEARRLVHRHRIWRQSFRELWDCAGLREGMRVLDLAPGPGDSSFDLAGRVGPTGLVIGAEYRNRFAQSMIARARKREIQNLMVLSIDLAAYAWPKEIVDAIWGSWALLHVQNRPSLIEGLHRALKPQGMILLQEFCDYGSWRLAPRSSEFDSYISRVINYWSEGGREIDAGIALPQLLREAGFEIEIVRPQMFAARPKDAIWSWSSLLARRYALFLAEHGVMARDDAQGIETVLDAYEANDNSIMLTPSVFQIVARKRR
jgi:demethylmenaquinone methyltransferase/2-methoxy-6-polyprenyl-1,4-benzoquinol methylase